MADRRKTFASKFSSQIPRKKSVLLTILRCYFNRIIAVSWPMMYTGQISVRVLVPLQYQNMQNDDVRPNLH